MTGTLPCTNYPNTKTNIQGLRVGSGELVPAHFLIPVVFKVVKHKFEILALVSDIKGRTDLCTLVSKTV